MKHTIYRVYLVGFSGYKEFKSSHKLFRHYLPKLLREENYLNVKIVPINVTT